MNRLKFMEGKRVECYLLPPQAKLDKDRHRVIILRFSVKLNADLAIACADKIERAWEDIETPEREVSNVTLRSEVEHTDIDFFELPDSKSRVYHIRNATLDQLYIERVKGETYFYFAAELLLAQTPGLDKFCLSRYGTAVFCEFVRSQLAFDPTPPAEPLKDGGTKVTISMPGHEPIETTTQAIHNAAQVLKGKKSK